MNKEEELISVCMIFKLEENSALINLNTSMINSNTDSTTNNYGTLYTQWVAIMQKQSASINLANTFKKEYLIEKYDLLYRIIFHKKFGLKSFINNSDLNLS